MLKARKKISKRELKQDALVETYVKVTSFYEQNKRYLNIGVTALVVLVIGTVFYVNNRNANNEKAITALGEIYQYYDRAQHQVAIDGIPERNVSGLRSIVDNYGSTPAGELGRFYLANALFELEKYDEALEMFDQFDPGNDQLLTVSRLSGIAGCHESMGNYEEAAEFFEKAATKYSNYLNAAENMNNAARNFARAGNKERALALYRELKKQYPTTSFGREAERYITELSV
jgi:tetratricopeptide (TPR) repeat protein